MDESPPKFIYGTAWKKDRTAELAKESISAGFRAIDTAAQPRHYNEARVGEGIREALTANNLSRDQIYVQTKFCPAADQDRGNMPYAADADLATQVHASIASSLLNLHASNVDESYLDCVLLHSPLPNMRQTLEAWRTLETYVPHKIRRLGICNISQPLLEVIYRSMKVKPAVVQNAFSARTAWDVDLRRFCLGHGIVYQSFWTLTANRHLLKSTPVTMLVQFVGVSEEVALYSLVLALPVVVLNGTTNLDRMREDLDGVRRVWDWRREKEDSWNTILGDFRHMIGEGDESE